MPEIIRAKHLGFCQGVKCAIELSYKILKNATVSGAPVYVCGSIIHNKHVSGELSEMGLVTLSDISELPTGATLIVRSHGESKAFFENASENDARIYDATCQKVRNIQEIVSEAPEGQAIIIVGDPSHPEVKGINGWCDGRAIIIATGDEARSIELPDGDIMVVSQTTFNEESFNKIVDILRKRVEIAGQARNDTGTGDGDICVFNTVCAATRSRQDAARELASQVDAMVVVGDSASSNTRKLYEIALEQCNNTILIENADSLRLQELSRYVRIGITAGASTPESIIKEVITRMSEFKSENYEQNPMFEYMDEIDKALRLPRNGDVITGEVIQVSDKDVIVNIGCKKDGIIPRSEVTLEEGQSLNDVFHEGDEIQAKVLKTDDGDGNILMSKKRVIVSEHWEDINRALEDKETLEVTIVREVNGGVIANFEEISGFIPMSQLSDRYVETATEFVGETLSAKVMRVDQKRNKVVFSHKAVLAEERQKRMLEIWDTINVGDIIKGKVMRFTDYGAFVDIGGIDGLLHISEISWGKLRHPDEMLALDQEIDVKVLSMNKDKEKISLSYKQNLPEPWAIINDKYTVGQVISGKAVQLKEYGVFVELEPGLDGLVHISEIAFKRVNNISDEIEVGQDITAKILEIDRERRRISLSIKETLEKPDDDELEEDAVADAEFDAAAETETDAIENASDVATEAPVETDLQAPDPEAEPAIEAEDAAEVFEDAIVDADLETPDTEEASVGEAEEVAEVFEEAVAEAGDSDLEIPEPDAKPEESAEDAAVVFEEAPEVFEDTAESAETPEEEPSEEKEEAKEESAE